MTPRPVEYVVRDKLLADAIIRGMVADRCYPMKRPAASGFPCMTYSVGSDPLVWGIMGDTRMQVSCFAMTYDEARVLSLRVRAVLDEMTADEQGIEIPGIDTDLPGMRTHEPDTGVHHHAIDALVTYIYR